MGIGQAVKGTVLAAALLAAVPAQAACGNGTGSDFAGWLAGYETRAAAAGVSQRAIQAGLAHAAFDQNVIGRDRAQSVFAQNFLQFSGRMVNNNRLSQGKSNLAKYKDLFARVEAATGVPGPVLASFWGLETDFGANIGNSDTIRSLSTLAYDCRRSEKFETELTSALKIVDRGDLSADEMRGPWAGELGQLQFLPSHYLNFGTDGDGNGHVDLLHSVPDVMMSGGKMLQAHGWRAGEPWLQEVRVPESLDWSKADLAIRLPRSQWVGMGVQGAGGTLPSDQLPAALLLPMGRHGPAFLAYPNFDVYLEWNQSLVYATTAAYFATRLAGAPAVNPGSADAFTAEEAKSLQTALSRRGYDVGKADGNIGAKTRAAIKDMQIKLGLPADGYPSRALIQAMN